MAQDPVCGAEVDPLRARAMGIFEGRTYYFCSAAHKEAFAHGERWDDSAAQGRNSPTPAPLPVLAAVAEEEATVPSPPPRIEPAPSPKRSPFWLMAIVLLAVAAAVFKLL